MGKKANEKRRQYFEEIVGDDHYLFPKNPEMDDNEELEELIRIRDYANKKINTIRLRMHQVDKTRVPAQPLVPLIQAWIDSGETLGRLSRITGVSDKTIRDILRGRTSTVLDTTADKFLMGLGLPHVYNDLYPPKPPPSKYYEE